VGTHSEFEKLAPSSSRGGFGEGLFHGGGKSGGGGRRGRRGNQQPPDPSSDGTNP